MVEDFWILLKGGLLKGMDIMLLHCHFQTVKKLMILKEDFKRRFITYSKFFLDHKKCMNGLLKKGYVRRCNETPTGKTWDIPHHAIYHLRKSGKIGVVFDCSAELDGKSINKELLPGRDLTNQIVSIVVR